jgi:hypothetical protein
MLESFEAAKAQHSQSQPGESCDDDAADLAYLVEMLSRAKVTILPESCWTGASAPSKLFGIFSALILPSSI